MGVAKKKKSVRNTDNCFNPKKLDLFFFNLRRKSFFSGHASFSMFTMLYLAVSTNYNSAHSWATARARGGWSCLGKLGV